MNCAKLAASPEVTYLSVQRFGRTLLDVPLMLPLILIVCLTAAAAQASEANRPPRKVSSSGEESPWKRVVMVGASATSGFFEINSTNNASVAELQISRYLDAALLLPHEPVRNFGNVLFFIYSPAKIGGAQIERALKVDPSLVIGVDFLFWFCYGALPAEEERLERLEKGLEILNQVQCALVVGDIPDASAASGMLHPSQVPQPATLSRANSRIREWAAARKQVVVVGLADFMRAATLNEPIEIGGERFENTRILLQQDKLHPTARGAAVLALAILERLSAEIGLAGRKEIRWDVENLLAESIAHTASQ